MPIKKERPKWAIKIAELRSKLGMNQTSFAGALSTAQGNISKWESGANKPMPDMMIRLAALAPEIDKFFFLEEAGIPPSFFMGNIANVLPKEVVSAVESVVTRVMTPTDEYDLDVAMVPVLSDRVAAGMPLSINDRDIQQMVPVLASWLPRSGKTFGMQVKGDSMIPILREGNIVLVDTGSREPRKLIDRMVAARVGDGITIKWLRADGRYLLLVPENTSPRHPVKVLEPNDDWSIAGEVIKWIGAPPPPPKRRS